MTDIYKMDRFRRFKTITFGGSAGPSPSMSNRYSVNVMHPKNGSCFAEFSAKSLRDAFKLIRILLVKYPDRLITVSRVSYSGKWISPIYKPISAVPDYPDSYPFSKYERKGKVWIERVNPISDILEALQA